MKVVWNKTTYSDDWFIRLSLFDLSLFERYRYLSLFIVIYRYLSFILSLYDLSLFEHAKMFPVYISRLTIFPDY